MQNALEETRALLEQGDRNRRALEQELSDTNEVRYEVFLAEFVLSFKVAKNLSFQL